MFYFWGTLLGGLGILRILCSFYFIYDLVSFLVCLELFRVLLVDGEIYLFLDWVRLIFCGVVIVISGCVLFYRDGYIIEDRGKFGFCFLIIIFVFRMIFMVMIPNIFMIILG